MAEPSISTALVGCTGLVGSQILSVLSTLPSQPTIHAIARRTLPTASLTPTLHPHISATPSDWPTTISSLKPPPNVLLSALGTTKAAAGSLAAQRAIDYDLNLSLARAAKDSGVRVYVLISSAGVSTTSPFPYSKMKAELEEAVKALEFPYTVIVKPGLLMGDRTESRPAEAVLRGVARGLGRVSTALTDWWAQDAEVIGRAAVKAGLDCVEGRREEGIWVVGQGDIVRLGRTEWK